MVVGRRLLSAEHRNPPRAFTRQHTRMMKTYSKVVQSVLVHRPTRTDHYESVLMTVRSNCATQYNTQNSSDILPRCPERDVVRK